MNKTYKIIQNSIFLCLLIISGKLSFPLGGISFTLQLFIVFIIALLSKPLDIFLIFFTYIFFGLIGLPIFSVGGGISYIYQPSFGFLIGFWIMCYPIYFTKKLLSKFIKNIYLTNLISCLIGLISDYIIGFIYAIIVFNIYLGNNYSIYKILALVIVPFIILDLIKLIFASIIEIHLEKVLTIKKNNLN